MRPPVVLTVAGTDSGGAAGIAADLATFAAHDTHGSCVVTALTAQDTTGVHAVHVPPLDIIEAQIGAVLDDLPVSAAKTGMLGTPETVRLVAERLGHLTLVVDPVLVATSGAVLGDDAVRAAYIDCLLPVADVITPNLDEARSLLGHDGAPEEVAARLSAFGPAVVVTGGLDLPDPDAATDQSPGSAAAGTCTDWLAMPGRDPVALPHPAVATGNDHGTGCTFSAALAAQIALRADNPDRYRTVSRKSVEETCGLFGSSSLELTTAVREAAAYTSRQLSISRTWQLGRGRGPIAHTGSTQPSSIHPIEGDQR